MTARSGADLSRLLRRLPARERQIATLIYSHGEMTAAEVASALPDPITSSAIRSMLRRLETKGILQRRQDGKRYVYLPASCDPEARLTVLRRVAFEHFGGSVAEMISEARKLVDVEQSHDRDRCCTAAC